MVNPRNKLVTHKIITLNNPFTGRIEMKVTVEWLHLTTTLVMSSFQFCLSIVNI